MKFSPNFGIAISVVAVLVSILAVLSPSAFPTYVPANVALAITSTAAFLNIIFNGVNTVLHLYSSSAPGPLAPADPPAVVAAQKVADLPAATPTPVVTAAKDAAVAAIKSQ